MDLNKELSVKGFCFRTYKDDNKTVAEKVKACGLDKIDLSGPQVNFKDPSKHESTIEIYQTAGIEIVGIGAVHLSGEADDEELFKFCQKAKCRSISISGKPESFYPALKQAAKWADKYDMLLAIHNHGGYDWLGNSQILEYILKTNSQRVGLCLDTAWAIQAGENPVEWLEKFKDRIYAVHFKDFLFDSKGKHKDVIVGEGALDLKIFVTSLNSSNFAGPAIVEYEADVDNPVPALSKCIASIKKTIEECITI